MNRTAFTLGAALLACSLYAEPEVTFANAVPFRDFQKRIDWSWNGAWKNSNFDRETISLNGFWNFYPASEKNEKMPQNCDFYFRVPAQSKGGAIGHFIRYKDGRAIGKFNGKSTGWNMPMEYLLYRRTIDIPAKSRFAGKELWINIEQIACNSFQLLVNGRSVPVPKGFSAGRLNIDKFLKFGAQNTFEFNLNLEGDPQKLSGGLVGAINLEAIPVNNLGEPAIYTLLDAKKIDVEFFNRTADFNGASALFEITDAKTGESVYKKTLPLKNRVTLDFVTPKLWSPDSPNLYYLTITATDKNGKSIEKLRRRFGFREFKVSGGQYLLNGKPLFLRGDTNVFSASGWTPVWKRSGDYFRKYFRHLKDMNMNFCYSHGSIFPEFYDIADEEGFLVLVNRSIPYEIMWPKDDQFIYSKIDSELKQERRNPRLMNHPSQIGFIIDVWYNMHQGVMNPEYFGRKYDSKDYKTFSADGKIVTTTRKDPNLAGMRLQRKERLDHMAEIYRRYFPEFQSFTGGSGEVDGIYASHIYHTWGAQNLEMRAFFSRWGLQPNMPVFIGEFFIPYNASLRRIDVMHGPDSTPYYLENSARWFGNPAYRFKPSYALLTMHDATPGTSVVSSTFDKLGKKEYYFQSDFYAALIRRSMEEQIPGFLYSGANGLGMFGHVDEAYAGQLTGNFYTLPLPEGNLSKPDKTVESVSLLHLKRPSFDVFGKDSDYRYSEIAAPLHAMMADHYAGFYDSGADPYALDHAYFSGEKIGKNLVILNRCGKDAAWSGMLTLSNANGEIIARRKVKAAVKAGGRAVVPVGFAMPKTTLRRALRLTAALTDGNGEKLNAACELEVFPLPGKPLTGLNSKLYVFGMDADALAALRKLGADAQDLKNLDNLPKNGILVIGRGALGKLRLLPDLNALAANGLNILILEQQQNASSELIKVRSRQAFINAAGHPAFDGLQDRDFYCWRGSRSIAPAYQENTSDKLNWSDNGNRNMVASYVFRRPAAGNFRSLLVSGFDLYQTPLLEYTGRKGSWIASQLEISERIGKDPAATRILTNLIGYLDSRASFSGKTAFLGSENGESFLKGLRCSFRKLDQLSADSLAEVDTLLIADPDFAELDRARFPLLNFVYNGGRVFYIHTGKQWRSTWLPFAMDMKEQKIRAALTTSDSPDMFWRNGWDNNDMYWHDEFKLPVFDAPRQVDATSPAVAVRRKYGAGEFVFTTVTPERFGKTPAQGKACRMLSAMLTAAGVTLDFKMQPYKTQHSMEMDLVPFLWEFALDPENAALKEGWHLGKKGSAKWMQGQIRNDGTHVRVGMNFEQFLKQEYDGWCMYRLNFNLDPDFLKEKTLYLQIGAVDDFDEVYINGVKIGATGKETPNWWMAPRLYKIPQGVLKAGRNLIAVRVFDDKGGGGITQTPVSITNVPSIGAKAWQTPYPDGSKRDYEYNPDIVRSY